MSTTGARPIKLAEHELDAANAHKFEDSRDRYCCDGRCNERQGRGECPRYRSIEPIEEFPPLNWKSMLFGAICIVGVVGYCVLTSGA